ncbi:GDSL-like Lipase/Acylhydrolase family protein [Lentzea waywayandensis]|uniref:GDSL-like Lipase/Acylhydrolase family protein n=1 Tax=Lentzea waywayandensis TaxID=84724 RepID=A0A1I6FIF4_9PSEU|nr:GDSL-type esterase/lipase family protein [Lentzea waywayandensis]SFR29664.1 GDSL-like Lipase/Acylhydrolase family protein [Lentzea waywayandensis]
MRKVLFFAAIGLLTILLVVSDHVFPPPSEPDRETRTAVVALGDSTMSGEGAGSYEPGTDGEDGGDWCHRSRESEIMKTEFQADQKINLACSGANSDKLRNEQLPKLRAIAGTNQVVAIVVAIGANDDPRFSEILNKCFEAWGKRSDCTSSVAPEWTKRVRRMIPKVENTLSAIRQTMRDSGYLDSSYQLVVQSYAAPVSPKMPQSLQNLSGCPLRTADLEWVVEEAVPELSNGLRTAAAKVNARFLDLARAGEGHEACVGGSKPETEWFTRLTVDFDGLKDQKRASHALQESFHPNARGHEQIGRCLTEFLASDKRDGACVPRLNGSLGLTTES